MDKHFLTEILQNLNNTSANVLNANTFIGLKGYIDFIPCTVKSQNENRPEYFTTINDSADHLGKAAAKSAQIELLTQETKPGANAPIIAHALGSLGFKTTCIGNFNTGYCLGQFSGLDKEVSMIT